MKKYHLLLLSVLSGLLFTLGWPANGFPGLLFIAFVPLFFIDNYIDKHRDRFNRYSIWFYVYPAFLIWNGLCTWWVWNATPGGGVAAVVVNAFFMALVFNIYHISKRNIYPSRNALFILALYWISFEYFHLNWDMNWPWLNLGNGFANYVKWIQWYEFTGTFGGTLWILVINILIYRTIKTFLSSPFSFRSSLFGLGSILIIAIPLIISFVIYRNYKEDYRPVRIIITQPNVDPYTEQYSLPPSVVINRNLSEAEPYLDEHTDFIVSPESAIQERIWERAVEQYRSLNLLKQFIHEHPHTSIIIGASTRKEFLPGDEISATARKFIDVDKYYDAFNTAFYLDTGNIRQWSHKSRLTPGVESMPFPKYLKFLESLAIDMGGTVGSLGVDPEPKVFVRASDSLKTAAPICFESIFGEFFAGFVRNGAELIFVITNDGWWGNTPGYKQHFSFSRMRAIENRRSIARSANTGISAFINQRGDVMQELGYWIPGALSQTLNANTKLTFYTRYGDYIARISSFITAILLLFTIASILIKRKKPLVSTK